MNSNSILNFLTLVERQISIGQLLIIESFIDFNGSYLYTLELKGGVIFDLNVGRFVGIKRGGSSSICTSVHMCTHLCI